MILLREHEQEGLGLERVVLDGDGRDQVDRAASLPLVVFGIELERDVGRDGCDRDEPPLALNGCAQEQGGVETGACSRIARSSSRSAGVGSSPHSASAARAAL